MMDVWTANWICDRRICCKTTIKIQPFFCSTLRWVCGPRSGSAVVKLTSESPSSTKNFHQLLSVLFNLKSLDYYIHTHHPTSAPQTLNSFAKFYGALHLFTWSYFELGTLDLGGLGEDLITWIRVSIFYSVLIILRDFTTWIT